MFIRGKAQGAGPSAMPSAPAVAAGHVDRRHLLAAGLVWPATAAWAAKENDAETLLRGGGVVVAFRHAVAPGTLDPPGFTLGDCRTQRNLNDEGRAQARRIGAWFKARSLQPERVRSSPWCRCVDTAQLAFGQAETYAALGLPRGALETTNTEALRALRGAVMAASMRHGRFEAWVTHNFVLSDLVGRSTAFGEGLVLRADAAGAVKVLARLPTL